LAHNLQAKEIGAIGEKGRIPCTQHILLYLLGDCILNWVPFFFGVRVWAIFQLIVMEARRERSARNQHQPGYGFTIRGCGDGGFSLLIAWLLGQHKVEGEKTRESDGGRKRWDS
jgi:hypothetical protein